MELREIRSSGEAVPETSYYGTLEKLFNQIGTTLKPKVRCIVNIKNRGAGIPDGGFFTSDQLTKSVTDRSKEGWGGEIPARGVFEAKSTGEDVWKIADGQQVQSYLGKYGQVLVTNYRDFLLLGSDLYGKPTNLESYRLADSELTFWEATKHPKKTRDKHEKRFTEYLLRAMLSAAELRLPENLAWLLASYARDARERIETADLSDLNDLREKLQAVLGITFGGKEGEHFFRSTLIQTIFYGIFAAWVLWSRDTLMDDSVSRFDWRVAGFELRVPILRKLFEQVATSTTLEDLNLIEVLNWAGVALNRVNRKDFFQNFEEKYAVQYFYEPFLEAFDPQLRKRLGVWYTPPEIVEYMVERVDRVLREELDEPDGLAADNVYVLDPCCGTGAYLVAVLRRIEKTLQEKGEDALIGEEIKKAAMKRVFGFEILPASFVISHLEVSAFSRLSAGMHFSKDERPAIYLTNALTGWESMELPKQLAMEKGFQMEWEAASKVKRDTPILVILGNPPYNAFAGVSPEEEAGLVEPYKEGLREKWKIKKFNLDDLYVRFFRLAERRIAEMTGRGVVCFISNFSYLRDPSFIVMRQSFLNNFDKFWFDCLNGDSRETGKLTPEGKPDPSVFSTKYNKAGIRVGTAIGLMLRTKKRKDEKKILFRHYWGVAKKTHLLEALKDKRSGAKYKPVEPAEENRFSFRPMEVGELYSEWPALVELCQFSPSNGLMEKRNGALIDTDRAALEARMQAYYDANVEWETLKASEMALTKDAAGFKAKDARAKIVAAERYQSDHVMPYVMRPFDTRWCYYSPVAPLWNRARPSLRAQCWEGNHYLISRVRTIKYREGTPFYFAGSMLSDDHLLAPDAYCFPLRLRGESATEETTEPKQQDLLDTAKPRANLSPKTRLYLNALEIEDYDNNEHSAALVWMHALAIGYSLCYLIENSDGVKQDWPRVPLPDSKENLIQSAELGWRVAHLLDTRKDIQGVTCGTVRAELRVIGITSHIEGEKVDVAKGELAITAGWGHLDNRGATMPGAGRLVEREFDPEEFATLESGAESLGLGVEDAVGLLGETTLDVHLNEKVFWKNIPSRIWEYRIGGYQVIKKWLSYREKRVIGRSLTVREVREVTNMARRIAALLLLQPELNTNYHKVKESSYPWNRG